MLVANNEAGVRVGLRMRAAIYSNGKYKNENTVKPRYNDFQEIDLENRYKREIAIPGTRLFHSFFTQLRGKPAKKLKTRCIFK